MHHSNTNPEDIYAMEVSLSVLCSCLENESAVSPTLLRQLIMSYEFDLELSKNFNFDVVIEQQPLWLVSTVVQATIKRKKILTNFY